MKNLAPALFSVLVAGLLAPARAEEKQALERGRSVDEKGGTE
jgi:hypothetical protein